MTLYRARLNESPTMIARRFGVPLSALIAANRHKPTKRVGNVTTWRELRHNETIRLPAGAVGTLGDFLGVTPSSPSSPHVMISKGSPAAADVALWQTIIGVTPDGSFGSNTEAATKKWQSAHGLLPDGVVGPKTWAAALGTSAGPVAPAPAASSTPTAPPSGLTAAARAAVAALSADPNYCTSVARVGTSVNTAVHNFKAAWNAANPTRPVPIGTGKYEPVVASALSETLGGSAVPPGCGAASAPTAAATPAPTSAPAGSSMPATSGVPAAVLALLTVDPCLQGNASIVAAAQVALKIANADGKYGSETASAAKRVLPNAPAACSPRPAWWAPPGQSNASSGASQAASAAQSAANTAAAAAKAAQNATTAGEATSAATAAAAAATAAATAAQNAAPDQKPAADAAAATAAQAAQAANSAAQQAGGGSAITPPEAPKKLSTGAIVAGALGAAALVGVAAMALSGKKGGGHRRASGGHKRKTSKRKHSKRKSKKRK